MAVNHEDIDIRADVLFSYFYDDETGGFYTSYADKRDPDVTPSLFSTSEALFALLQSPAKAEYREEISAAIKYLVDELESFNCRSPPYGNAERLDSGYSTLSLSFSLIVLTRGQKFIDRHRPSTQLSARIERVIKIQLESLLNARYEDGWGYTPDQCVPEKYEFEEDVYCTAIALQALINCRDEHFQLVSDWTIEDSKIVVVDGFSTLTELASIPDVSTLAGQPDDYVREVYDEAILMTHWMHVLSHFLYDTRRWAESVESPYNAPEVQQLLEESSSILRELIKKVDQHPDKLPHGFASLEYKHKLEYPRRTTQGHLKKEIFSFELPGTTALPALVLNPHIPIWSDANTEIYQSVLDQFDEKEDDLRRYHFGDGTAWPIYHFSAPLVGISFMESINQSIKAVVRYFIREGDVLTDENTTDSEDSIGDSGKERENTSVPNKSQIKDDTNLSHSDEVLKSKNSDLNSIQENESWIISGARRLDQWISRMQAQSRAAEDWAKSYGQIVLIPTFVLALMGYGYTFLHNYSGIQILSMASLTGFLGFLVLYESVSRWTENRSIALLSGSLVLVVITASTAVTTEVSNDVTFLVSIIMQALAIISNLIVYSTPNTE